MKGIHFQFQNKKAETTQCTVQVTLYSFVMRIYRIETASHTKKNPKPKVQTSLRTDYGMYWWFWHKKWGTIYCNKILSLMKLTLLCSVVIFVHCRTIQCKPVTNTIHMQLYRSYIICPAKTSLKIHEVQWYFVHNHFTCTFLLVVLSFQFPHKRIFNSKLFSPKWFQVNADVFYQNNLALT